MRQFLIVIGIVLAFTMAISSSASAGVRTVSEITVTLGDWEFVPVMNGRRAEGLVALRDPALAIGENVTAVWFQRVDDSSWRAFAWAEPGNMKALAYLKSYYGLSDSTDALWPDPDAQQGVDPAFAVAPDAFARGVFAHDAFAPVIQSMSDPQPILTGLAGIGYPAAAIPIQTTPTNCMQDQVLTTLAAMVEADLGMDVGGTLMATFAIPYSECDFWRSLAAPLDSDGVWMMPDLTDYTVATTAVDPADAWQSVVSGSIFGGPQTVLVEIGGLDGDDEPFAAARLVIALVDVTPPTLVVELLGDGMPPMVSPGGVDYFVAPVTVSAIASALDNVDSVITNSVIPVNGSIGCEGPGPVVIASTGYYIYEATATDAAGNTAYYTRMFEVRDRFNHEAAAAIESLTVTPGTSTDLVEARLLLTSDMFEAEDINLATVALWLSDAEGQPIGSNPLVPAPGYILNGAYDPSLVGLNAGVWRLAMQGNVPAEALAQAGVRFSVTGSGLHGTPEAFDLMVVSEPFAANAAAQPTLLSLLTPMSSTSSLPNPRPGVSCRWVDQLILDEADTHVNIWTGLCGSSVIYVNATGTSVNGQAHASDAMCFGTSNPAESGGVASGATYIVLLEPRGCCVDCSISIVARPKFKAKAEINPPASALAGGLLSIATPCGNTEAAGGVGVGDFDTSVVEITIGDYSFPIPINDASQSVSQTFQGNMSCVVNACRVEVSIATGAYLSVSAAATILNWYAEAFASIRQSDLGLTVTPWSGGGCNVENDGHPFKPRPPPPECDEPGPDGGGGG
ncbi:MAG: hypothetical protein KIT88_03870 [Phycisphaeraceae bacterium]|nr:hypothetical protein [Phycisphaeraceae bacterium]